MKRDGLQAALSTILDRIRAMGPEGFRAELEATPRGDIADALGEIELFVAQSLSSTVMVSCAVRDAIHWGAGLDVPFELSDISNWIAANDGRFALAA